MKRYDLRKLMRGIARQILGGIFILFVLPILYVIELFCPIRIGEFREDRIGHLAQDNELLARMIRNEPKHARTKFVFFAWNPANKQLLRMWKRRFTVIENRWVRHAYNGAKPILTSTKFHQKLPNWHNSPSFDILAFGEPALSFTKKELQHGEELLSEMGIGKNDWFVCLHSRDPAYLARRHGFGGTVYDPNHHQNSAIENYIEAARWIARQGGFVIRMGAIVEKPLSEIDPRIIDYATRYRSDFMDIYLCAKCRFFLGGNSGLTVVPSIFNVPVAAANIFPFSIITSGIKALYTPKLVRRISDQSICSLRDLREIGLLQQPISEWGRLSDHRTYTSRGLEVIDNDEEDILSLTLDMCDLIEDRAPPGNGAFLQERYRSYYTGIQGGPNAGRVSPRFLMRHRELVELE